MSVAYGLKDGMLDAECNGGVQFAGIKTRDGRLWFPTQKGAAIINPVSLPLDSAAPPVVIESATLDRQAVSIKDVIEISPDTDALEINFTGLGFDKPEQIRFRYKLEGLDKNWTDAGTRRTAYFTHLPAGEYDFRVVAASAGGAWNEATGAKLKISVNPPYWETWWFMILAVCVVAAIAASVYLYRVRLLKRANFMQEDFSRRLIESQKNERQRIAAELHDSIGQELLIIKNWALLGLKKSGGAGQAQFDEISATASQAIEEVREISYNLRPYQLDELGLTKAVEAMLKRVANAAPIEFTAEIDDIDKFFPLESEINFYRIVQEILNNIVKHSAATVADIKIKRDANVLSLLITDDGAGFDTNALDAEQRRGFGLAGINERAKILGGRLIINSVIGIGTSVALTINLREEV